MFGMFKRNAVPADLSKLTVKDIEVLLKKESPQEAGAVLRRAAKEGSTDAAVFLSTMLDRAIQVKGKEHTPKQMLDEYVLFTEMAANRGDLGSQFNIAKHYVSLSMKDGRSDGRGGLRNSQEGRGLVQEVRRAGL